jgi:trigger factor
MRVDIEEIDACTKRLSIEVPTEEVGRAFEGAYSRLQRTVRIPGFRKGKIPRSLLKRNYKDVVERDVLETLIPESYTAALNENSLQAVGQPKVDEVEMNEAEPLRFKATIEVIPPFDLPVYEEREFEKPIPRVSDEDVDHMLEHLAEQHAQLENVEERPVQDGDYVILDFVGTLEGIERDDLKSEGQAFMVGRKNLLPELEDALPGMNLDETRRVEVTFPEDHSNADLAGKLAHFSVTVREIKAPVLAELNDDFARSLGEYQSLDDLRAAVREDLEKNADQQGLSALRKSVVETLAEETQVEIPKGLIEAEQDSLVQQLFGMVRPEERKNLDRTKLAEDLAPQAHKNVRQTILLDRIGDLADIHVTPAQVEAEVRRMAEHYGKPYAEVRALLEKRDGLEEIEGSLRRNKVTDHLVEKVKIVSKEVDTSVLAGHSHDHEDEEASEIPVPADAPVEE